MTRITQSPLELLGNLDRIFTQSIQPTQEPNRPHRIYRNEHGITIEVDLPGASKDDLHLKTETRTLKISLEPELGESYQRQFKLSPELDLDAITASFNDGVLKIEIPEISSQTRNIEIN